MSSQYLFINKKKSHPLAKLTAVSALLIGSLYSASTHSAGTIKISDEASVTVGAGLRTQATFAEDSAPDGSNSTDFDVGNIRLYVSGQVTDKIGLTFNTDRVDGNIDVIDAIARLEFSDAFNIWAGKTLVPADRIELNGPFYGLTWNQYTQPLFASDQDNPGDGVEDQAGTFARDTGITVWGDVGKFQYVVGIFEGVQGGPNSSDNPLYAGRFSYNFLNKEENPGYYTSSTYFGGLGNIFTLAFSFQSQEDGVGSIGDSGDFFGWTVDLLSETVLGNGDVLTIEAEYKDFDSDFTGQALDTTPSGGCAGTDGFCLFDGDSAFISAAYLFKNDEAFGSFQPYARYVTNDPSDTDDTDLFELGLNYIIKGHSARLNVNYATGDANISGFPGADVDVLSFGIQIQI